MRNLHGKLRQRAFASFFAYFSERMPIASRSSSSMPLLLQLSSRVLHFHSLLNKKSHSKETKLCHAMARGTARGRGRAQTDVTSRLRSFVAPRADNGASCHQGAASHTPTRVIIRIAPSQSICIYHISVVKLPTTHCRF